MTQSRAPGMAAILGAPHWFPGNCKVHVLQPGRHRGCIRQDPGWLRCLAGQLSSGVSGFEFGAARISSNLEVWGVGV